MFTFSQIVLSSPWICFRVSIYYVDYKGSKILKQVQNDVLYQIMTLYGYTEVLLPSTDKPYLLYGFKLTFLNLNLDLALNNWSVIKE
jgi:hypothetical protein